MKIIVKEKEKAWISHPIAKGVKIKILISKEEQHDENVKCMLVKIAKGLEVPMHVHIYENDILYPLSGKFRMLVDGIGDFEVSKGMVVRIPKGIKHKIYDVQEDVLIYDIFSPAIIGGNI